MLQPLLGCPSSKLPSIGRLENNLHAGLASRLKIWDKYLEKSARFSEIRKGMTKTRQWRDWCQVRRAPSMNLFDTGEWNSRALPFNLAQVDDDSWFDLACHALRPLLFHQSIDRPTSFRAAVRQHTHTHTLGLVQQQKSQRKISTSCHRLASVIVGQLR